MRAFAIVLATWSVVVGVAAASGQAGPRSVLLARGRTEPVVAVDPQNSSIIVVGSNTNYSAPVGDTFPTAYFTSHDAGKTFAPGAVPILRPYTTGADPSVTIAHNGTVYYLYLGETPSYCSGGRSAILLTTSRDGGRTFRTPVVVDSNSGDDKPNLALETAPGNRVHLFVTWTRWHSKKGSEMWYARSLDGGASFSRAQMLYSSGANNFGSVPAIGPSGHVYVFWSSFPEAPLAAPTRTVISMRASSDDGGRFAPARTIVGPFWSVPKMAEPGSLRNLTAPAVAVGRDGAMYLAWAVAKRQRGPGSVDANVEIRASRTGGRTWTRAVRVNDSGHGDRFMPAMTVLADGSVGIAFYDRRRSAEDLDIYAARASTTGSLHISSNVRFTQGHSIVSDIHYIAPGSTCFSPGRFFGDYIGTAGCGRDTLCVAWADSQLQVAGETDIWFAKGRLPRVGATHTAVVARAARPVIDLMSSMQLTSADTRATLWHRETSRRVG